MKKKVGPKKEVKPTYPSTFGSHASMIADKYVEFNERMTDHTMVVCEDERGFYITDRKTLDNGLCDRKRIDNDTVRKARMGEWNLS